MREVMKKHHRFLFLTPLHAMPFEEQIRGAAGHQLMLCNRALVHNRYVMCSVVGNFNLVAV
jgi:hypothetical protein